jgi:hypothetical protein
MSKILTDSGLGKDLKMTSDQYNMTLTVFFITYSLFGSNHVCPLLTSRDPVECPSKEIQATYLASHKYGAMGRRSSLNGLRQDVRATYRRTYIVGHFRGRTLSRSQLLSVLLVQKKRIWHSRCHFLLRRRGISGLFVTKRVAVR